MPFAGTAVITILCCRFILEYTVKYFVLHAKQRVDYISQQADKYHEYTGNPFDQGKWIDNRGQGRYGRHAIAQARHGGGKIHRIVKDIHAGQADKDETDQPDNNRTDFY